MFPILTLNNFPNSPHVAIQERGHCAGKHSIGTLLNHPFSLVLCKHGCIVILSNAKSVFTKAVANIVNVMSQNQVVRSYARGIVANMHYLQTRWNRTKMDHPRSPVAFNWTRVPTSSLDLSAFIPTERLSPRPATNTGIIWNKYFFPKSKKKRFGKSLRGEVLCGNNWLHTCFSWLCRALGRFNVAGAILLLCLVAYQSKAQVLPPPETNAPPASVCAVFVDNAAYCRTEYGRWYLTNWTKPSDLYLNGAYQSTEPAGTASIDFLPWPAKRSVIVGITDSEPSLKDDIITNILPEAVIVHYPGDVNGILSCLASGARVIVMPWNTSIQPSTDLSNAVWQCSQSNVIVVCSVPNSNISIDSPSTPSYPGSWNIPLCIPVCSSTRQDAIYSPTATGTNVIAAPGRVIVFSMDGTNYYGSGSSYAAPIVAGVAAWMLGQFDQTPQVIVSAIYKGLTQIDNRVAGRISMQGAVNALRPSVKLSVLGIDGASYVIERSTNLVQWSYFATMTANSQRESFPGYYRAKVL